jgi:hypothetical protein
MSAGPTFLLGAPRSGTSMLYRALCLHPDAAWISNWVRRAPGVAPLAALNRVAALAPARRRSAWFGDDGANAYRYGHARGALDRLSPQPVEGEPLFARNGIAPTPPSRPYDRVAARGLGADLRAVTRWSGGSHLIVKRIANNVRVGLLAEAFPDARWVDLVRDGRAVAVSLRQVDWWPTSSVWWYGGTPEDWAAEGRDPWELAARHWVEELHAIDAGLAEVPAERILRLRYEDVLEDPVEALGRVAVHAGLDAADPRWRGALADVRFPDNNRKWATALDGAALATVLAAQAPELTRRGYAP